MISTYFNILRKDYSLDRFMVDRKKLNANRFRFDKFLSKFGNIINIKILSGIIVNEYIGSLKLYNSHLLILVLDLPDDVKLKVRIYGLDLFLKRLSARHYMVINSSEPTNDILITTVKINNNEEEQHRSTLTKKYRILLCYYNSNMLRYRSIEQDVVNRKALLVSCGFISKWYIEKKKTRVVDHDVSRITKRCVTDEYFLDGTNTKVTDISSINIYWIHNPIYLHKYKISDILKSKNKSLIQALRWPLGKPSITFFRLWIIGEYGIHNINIDSIVRILKLMTRKKITDNCGLGDILISAFGIVRKQANKLGLNCSHITFRNFWKEVASIQLIRYNKYNYKYKYNYNYNYKIISSDDNQYKYLPFNPWLLDISKEVELWDDLKLNLLDKNKWYNDWPILART
nr:hypothetical protein TDPV-098 [Oriental turtle dovepox virus]